MRLDLALSVNVGNILYNCFMEPLSVQEKIIYYTDEAHVYSIKFIVRDKSNNTHTYACEDLYFANLEDEDDSERAWVLWAKNNKDFFDLFDHIETIKEIYKIGFCDGIEHKQKVSYQEMMQK